MERNRPKSLRCGGSLMGGTSSEMAMVTAERPLSVQIRRVELCVHSGRDDYTKWAGQCLDIRGTCPFWRHNPQKHGKNCPSR